MPYNLDSDTIQRILEQNDIVEVIEEYLPLKKAGANYSTLCPFHKEKTPSFIVSPDKQMFHCFGCGESGDSIGFLTKYKNYTFVEAAEYLAKRAGIVLEERDSSIVNINKQTADTLYKINREAAVYFYNNLKRAPHVLNYLKSRNIDSNVIKMFGIGYAIDEWDNLLNFLINKGYRVEDILKTGLIINREKKDTYYDRFRNRVIFPIFDIKKRIIGFGGRVLDDSVPKYLNSPDSLVFNKGYNLYGLHIAKENVRNKSFILVEGYMDVIKMHVHGYNTAVAALGTSFTENQVKLLKKYSKDFYLAFDSDEAGQKAALKAINLLKKNNLNAKVVIMEGAKDPDEFLNKFGRGSFDKLIENSLEYYDFIEFHFKEILENSNKVEYINKFFDNIVNVNSEIERELIFDKLSRKVGVSKESVINEFNKRHIRQKTLIKTAKPVVKPQVKRITTCYEEELIKLILLNNDFALKLSEIVNEDTFKDLKSYNMLKELYECRINDISIDSESLKNITGGSMNVNLQIDNVDYDNLEALFKDCMKRLKLRYYEEKKNELTNMLKQSDNQLNKKEKIMHEIYCLAKKIKSTKEEVN